MAPHCYCNRPIGTYAFIFNIQHKVIATVGIVGIVWSHTWKCAGISQGLRMCVFPQSDCWYIRSSTGFCTVFPITSTSMFKMISFCFLFTVTFSLFLCLFFCLPICLSVSTQSWRLKSSWFNSSISRKFLIWIHWQSYGRTLYSCWTPTLFDIFQFFVLSLCTGP